jgi:hypothetical protein
MSLPKYLTSMSGPWPTSGGKSCILCSSDGVELLVGGGFLLLIDLFFRGFQCEVFSEGGFLGVSKGGSRITWFVSE